MLLRWLKFNAVGLLGVLIQLGTLTALVSGLGIVYLAATAMAVETAVLHNFVWHEYFTWRDRTCGAKHGFLRRLLSFHVSNGVVSLVGNLLLMRLLVEWAHLAYVVANGVAILVCSMANFLLAERVVFGAQASAGSFNHARDS